MQTTIVGHIGTTIRVHSFVPSQPKASIELAYNKKLNFSYSGMTHRVPGAPYRFVFQCKALQEFKGGGGEAL